MDNLEKNILWRLLPYLSKYPIIFDVGSNKGEWSDLVIGCAHELHLFEPNEILLHYTMAKYDYAKNVTYCSDAAWKEVGPHDFFFFTNENNGLSSLYHNHKWDYLPMKEGKIMTTTLDRYCAKMNIGNVDFIKIDVEGAEYDVLLGCEKLLKERRVKFIQIEYSEHYKVAGHSLAKVNEYISRFGYKLLDADLKDNFVEDFELSNYIICMSEFTEDWNKTFVELTKDMQFGFALEIGCFEGLTSNHICDNLLFDDGRLVCVDPLQDEYLTENLSPQDIELNDSLPNFEGQYERFIRNTMGKPIELIRTTSAAAYPQLQEYRFDFIFIDGDHREKYVYWDGIRCFELLKIGGTLIFDDYEWSEGTKKGIDLAVSHMGNQIELEVKGNYVIVKRIIPE
jgi:FkbM family methyltransferase